VEDSLSFATESFDSSGQKLFQQQQKPQPFRIVRLMKSEI